MLTVTCSHATFKKTPISLAKSAVKKTTCYGAKIVAFLANNLALLTRSLKVTNSNNDNDTKLY